MYMGLIYCYRVQIHEFPPQGIIYERQVTPTTNNPLLHYIKLKYFFWATLIS